MKENVTFFIFDSSYIQNINKYQKHQGEQYGF